MELMSIYSIIVILICFLGGSACAYIVGRIDGIKAERQRQEKVRRMVGGYVPQNERQTW